MMKRPTVSWAWDAVFYHIYPLGLCGAPAQNIFTKEAEHRLAQLHQWIPHLLDLGCNAVYLGPVFESGTHGYDTVDYYTVDRRLGTNATLQELIAQLHAKGIRVILDGVFHHVGRDFWAFRDLQQKGPDSAYREWFAGVDFSRRGPYGDAFSYEGWHGHYNLVKLNLHHPDVRDHLLNAIQQWVEDWDIDGLRLDAADVMDLTFLKDLAAFCRKLRPDFWLVGEVIHGDYNQWANPQMLDATTNYECYKGLYSSHNDRNYFEIAHSLNRLFGSEGIYQGLPLYNFADNHDVNRVASTLRHIPHLYPLYALLFTMPGVPSLYYGSEWGIEGKKQNNSDAPLRPAITWPPPKQQMPHPNLAEAIKQFIRIRHEQAALRYGNYRQLFVSHQQIAFARQTHDEQILVAVNAADTEVKLTLPAEQLNGSYLVDLLDKQQKFFITNGQIEVDVPPCWARMLAVQ